MPEITKALFAVALAIFGLYLPLIGIYNALWASVEEQRKTNALSERMARVMESDE